MSIFFFVLNRYLLIIGMCIGISCSTIVFAENSYNSWNNEGNCFLQEFAVENPHRFDKNFDKSKVNVILTDPINNSIIEKQEQKAINFAKAVAYRHCGITDAKLEFLACDIYRNNPDNGSLNVRFDYIVLETIKKDKEYKTFAYVDVCLRSNLDFESKNRFSSHIFDEYSYGIHFAGSSGEGGDTIGWEEKFAKYQKDEYCNWIQIGTVEHGDYGAYANPIYEDAREIFHCNMYGFLSSLKAG